MIISNHQIESEENMGDSSKNEKIGKLYTFEFSTAEEEQRRDGEAADANKYSNNNDTISNDKSLKLIEEKEEMLGILDAKWSFKEICERLNGNIPIVECAILKIRSSTFSFQSYSKNLIQ